MLKRILTSLSLVLLAVSVYAADVVKVPQNQTGAALTNLDYSGVEYYRISASSVAVMVTSPSYNNNQGAANPCLVKFEAVVYGVAFSSLTPNTEDTFVILRDSTTPGVDMTHAICPEIMAGDINVNTNIVGRMITFNPPIRCKNGLSACLKRSSAVSPAGSVVIYYKFREKDAD